MYHEHYRDSEYIIYHDDESGDFVVFCKDTIIARTPTLKEGIEAIAVHKKGAM